MKIIYGNLKTGEALDLKKGRLLYDEEKGWYIECIINPKEGE